jgi:hypothetical protein
MESMGRHDSCLQKIQKSSVDDAGSKQRKDEASQLDGHQLGSASGTSPRRTTQIRMYSLGICRHGIETPLSDAATEQSQLPFLLNVPGYVHYNCSGAKHVRVASFKLPGRNPFSLSRQATVHFIHIHGRLDSCKSSTIGNVFGDLSPCISLSWHSEPIFASLYGIHQLVRRPTLQYKAFSRR